MSTLLEQASLVMIPSGYKEDVVYSVIPESGAGDLSFTRASDGTRINSAGLIENMPYNLVQYSEQFENGYWGKLNTTVTANTIAAPNNTITADSIFDNAVSGSHYISSSAITVVNGGVYTLTAYLKANTLSWVRLELFSGGCFFDLTNGVLGTASGATATITDAGGGWYLCSITVTSAATSAYPAIRLSTGNGVFGYAGTGKNIYAWGCQLVYGSTAKQYFATTNRQDVPRLNYQNGGGGCPSLLLEPQRTNLALYSDQFNNGYWTPSGCIVTANFAISPDGTQNADKILPNVTSGGFVEMQYTASVTSGTTYTYSQYVKANGYNYIQFIGSSAGFGTFYINYDIVNGVETAFSQGTTVGTITRSIQSVGNGWFRVSASVPAQATGSYRIVLNIIPASNSIRGVAWTSDGVSSVLYYGAQLEAGAYATSYIPTTSASATRVNDAFSRGNLYTNGIITSSGGTWFIQLKNNFAYTRDSASGIELASVGFTQRIILYNIGGVNRLSIFLTTGGLVYTTTTDDIKVAIKWNGSTATVYVNGVKVVNSATFTGLNMENLIGGQGVPFYIQQSLLFPLPLTDNELAQLTSL